MENKMFGIISFAVLVEGIITYFNQFFVNGQFSLSMLFSIVLGVVIAVSYKLDIPEYLNLKSNIPYIGNFLTGILISRGSNYLYDLLTSISRIK